MVSSGCLSPPLTTLIQLVALSSRPNDTTADSSSSGWIAFQLLAIASQHKQLTFSPRRRYTSCTTPTVWARSSLSKIHVVNESTWRSLAAGRPEERAAFSKGQASSGMVGDVCG
ncbi:hypothetical protein DL93DRAFT_1920017 [Clavulina sp. PMI_390]|nr:hypothetical protein DL93DRAFT_1920017 [Clavulina sp. PMI_390]